VTGSAFSLLLFLNGEPAKGGEKSEREFRGVISHSNFDFHFASLACFAGITQSIKYGPLNTLKDAKNWI